LLLSLLPRRFRERYADELREALELEILRVRATGSTTTMVGLYLLFFEDAMSTIVREWINVGRRRGGYAVRLLRESPAFIAAMATLSLIFCWAWARLVGSGADDTNLALIFAVAALESFSVWLFAMIVSMSYRLARGPIRGPRYLSVRRARLIREFAKRSIAVFIGAFAISMRRVGAEASFAGSGATVWYWIALFATNVGVLCVYVVAAGPLRLRRSVATPGSSDRRGRRV
jgi:hypothetical protein